METVTLRQKSQFYYLRIKLDIAKDKDLPSVQLDAVTFKSVLVKGLGSLHGQVGAAINVDVLKFDAKSLHAILKVGERCLVKLWSALTLLSCYQERRCVITVQQVSPHLLSLAAQSRQWELQDDMTVTR